MIKLQLLILLSLMFPARLFCQTPVFGTQNITKQISGRVFGIGQVFECDPFNYSEYGYLLKFGTDGRFTTFAFVVSPMINSMELRDSGTYRVTDTGLIISIQTRHMRSDTLRCLDPECLKFEYVQVQDTGFKHEFVVKATLSWCSPHRLRLHCDSFRFAGEPNYIIRIPDKRAFEDTSTGRRIEIDVDADTLGYYEDDTTFVSCEVINSSVTGQARKWVFRKKNTNTAIYLQFHDAEDRAILSGPAERGIFFRRENEFLIPD